MPVPSPTSEPLPLRPVAATGDLVGQALRLLEELAQAPEAEHARLRKQAQQLGQSLSRLKRASAGDMRRQRDALPAVDGWMVEILAHTRAVQSRENLLHSFLERYRLERRIGCDDATHDGPWLLTIERESLPDGSLQLCPGLALGVHAQAFHELCALHLPQARQDAFLGPVLYERRAIDGWYAPLYGGSALFDRLLDVERRFQAQRNYFVQACLLPGGRNHPGVGLFIAYPNIGEPDQPAPPSVLRQDQRILQVLEAAWYQSEHQLRMVAALSETNRRELIQLIAPGLMHHELGTTLRTLYSQVYEQNQMLLKHEAPGMPAWLDAALDYSYSVGNLAWSAHRVTDVFNNFDKRGKVESFALAKLVDDLHVLLHHRLGAAGTELRWDPGTLQQQSTTTDAVLLQQALLNVVINALNAIAEAQPPVEPPRWIQISLAAPPSHLLGLDICNSGPPVAPAMAARIFERGYTTRDEGHGQGLYLVRLIATYLGGSATLLPVVELPAGCHVGFRLQWQRHSTAQEGLARAVG